MSEPASISNGIAQRYATAVFEIAKEEGAIDKLAADAEALRTAAADSPEFSEFLTSPIYTREEMKNGITAVADKMGASQTMKNTLALMAENRRLFVVPNFAQQLLRLIAQERGQVTAEVTSAQALSDDQRARLAETLKSKVGSDVTIEASVDESLIGGMIVKVGSKMIDTSIRSKLAALQNTMKEVG
ncbi:MAG: F0F1 ATP synthase subunit delta [Shimia sp.]